MLWLNRILYLFCPILGYIIDYFDWDKIKRIIFLKVTTLILIAFTSDFILTHIISKKFYTLTCFSLLSIRLEWLDPQIMLVPLCWDCFWLLLVDLCIFEEAIWNFSLIKLDGLLQLWWVNFRRQKIIWIKLIMYF